METQLAERQAAKTTEETAPTQAPTPDPKILNRLGIFGWKKQDENLALASLLTGDPLLLIGNHGSAKTLIANKIPEALGLSFCF